MIGGEHLHGEAVQVEPIALPYRARLLAGYAQQRQQAARIRRAEHRGTRMPGHLGHIHEVVPVRVRHQHVVSGGELVVHQSAVGPGAPEQEPPERRPAEKWVHGERAPVSRQYDARDAQPPERDLTAHLPVPISVSF